MKVLLSLTYYRPHMSGLTIYVQNLAEELARRGHHVTVLTAQYDPGLRQEEVLNGVHVVRLPVQFWISKGAVMLGYLPAALRLVRAHHVVVISLPNTFVETLILCPLARFLVRRPLIAAYHSDLHLPPGLANRLVDRVVFLVNLVAGALADRLTAYTEDFANHSHVLSRFRHKTEVIPPPVTIPQPDALAVEGFRQRHAPNSEHLIGFTARLAAEKGVEYMLAALPRIQQAVPDAKVLFAGEYENVIGEEKYRESLQPWLSQVRDRWSFLGVLDPGQLATYYRACDVTVLPSINQTETFGFVQVESMLCGTPVVASDLPGVRVPVRTTRMGRVTPVCDAASLALNVVEVIKNRRQYVQPREVIERHFSARTTAERYEALCAGARTQSTSPHRSEPPG
jgi:glycosyltransferase involved in cell wall biosynthesis